jgi:hypothetical protein
MCIENKMCVLSFSTLLIFYMNVTIVNGAYFSATTHAEVSCSVFASAVAL